MIFGDTTAISFDCWGRAEKLLAPNTACTPVHPSIPIVAISMTRRLRTEESQHFDQGHEL
jgi:hypothetical protein